MEGPNPGGNGGTMAEAVIAGETVEAAGVVVAVEEAETAEGVE